MDLETPGLVRPTTEQVLALQPGRIARTPIEMRRFLSELNEARARGENPIAGGASFSDYAEGKILEHVVGRATFTKPVFWLALLTTVPTDESTGATIVEATYTGYARLEVPEAAWGAASGGEIKNDEVLTFPECTEGSSTIVGWAGVDSTTEGAGNVLCWGTATSTVISVTQSPATIATSGLVVKLD
jgi:hypothetical protein